MNGGFAGFLGAVPLYPLQLFLKPGACRLLPPVLLERGGSRAEGLRKRTRPRHKAGAARRAGRRWESHLTACDLHPLSPSLLRNETRRVRTAKCRMPPCWGCPVQAPPPRRPGLEPGPVGEAVSLMFKPACKFCVKYEEVLTLFRSSRYA